MMGGGVILAGGGPGAIVLAGLGCCSQVEVRAGTPAADKGVISHCSLVLDFCVGFSVLVFDLWALPLSCRSSVSLGVSPCWGRVLVLIRLNAYCLHVMYVIEHSIYVCNLVTLNENGHMVAIYFNAPSLCTLVIAGLITAGIYKSCNVMVRK